VRATGTGAWQLHITHRDQSTHAAGYYAAARKAGCVADILQARFALAAPGVSVTTLVRLTQAVVGEVGGQLLPPPGSPQEPSST
jgi:hypothetical protein